MRQLIARLRALLPHRGPRCTHEGRDEHGCWDCYNTGHAHAQDWRCRG